MKITSLTALSLMVTLACSFLTSSPLLKTPEPLYSISGTLHPARETTLPGNTRVLVLWTVVSEDDPHLYIFGEGTLNFKNYTFSIPLYGPPPAEAINQLEGLSLGYGRVILTADQKLKKSIPPDSFTREEILGIVASDMIFYIDGDTSAAPNVDWLTAFDQGYSVAREVRIDSGSDKFEPAAPGSLQLIIDDLDNIEVANWR
jgi:hypothetical protein